MADPVQEHIYGQVTPEDMVASSGLSYGAAGVCLVIILLLAQIWKEPAWTSHLWSLALASLALPIFVAVAIVDQAFGNMKLGLKQLQSDERLGHARAWPWFAACVCLYCSVGVLIFSMSAVAGTAYLL